MALNFSGDLARCEQNYAKANTSYEESISLLRAPRPGDLWDPLYRI